jgi:amino acid adenylation domain-containing protein
MSDITVLQPVKNGSGVAVACSAAQERIFGAHEMATGSGGQNISLLFRVDGPLDVDAVVRALGAVICRHEALRMLFVAAPDGLSVRLCPPESVRLEPVVLCDHQDHTAQLAMADAKFDLSSEFPVRCVIAQHSPTAFHLLFSFHHIAVDEWSVSTFCTEFAALYRGSTALPVPGSFREYVASDQERRESALASEKMVYWMDRLSEAGPVDLPYDRTHWNTGSAGVLSLRVDSDLCSAVDDTARELAVSSTAVLMTNLLVLVALGADSGWAHMGTVVADETRARGEYVLGPLINTIILAVPVDRRVTFREQVLTTFDILLEGFHHADVPYQDVLRMIRSDAGGENSQPFRIMFSISDASAEQLRLGPETLAHQVPLESAFAEYDILFHPQYQPDGSLTIRIEYSADHFDETTVSRIGRRYLALLSAAVKSGDASIDTIFETAVDRDHVLPYPEPEHERSGTAPEIFASVVAAAPEKIAVRCGGRTSTYAEIDRRSSQLAHLIGDVDSEELVGILLPRSEWAVIAIMAVWKAGAAYVPFEYNDSSSTRLTSIIDDTRLKILITDRAGVAALGDRARSLRIIDVDQSPGSEAGRLRAAALAPDSVAYVIYTSGSTGAPKGVMITHRDLAQLLTATRELVGYGPDDVWLSSHSFAFDFSVWEIWGPLLSGGSLVIAGADIRGSGYDLMDLAITARVTVLNQTPSAFRLLTRAIRSFPGKLGESSLRKVVLGGESIRPEEAGDWLDGSGTPEIINMYGITEGTVHTTFRPLANGDVTGAPYSAIGRPLPGRRVYLLDSAFRQVPTGAIGEIHLGGSGVARGYLHNPGLTAARFLPDPFCDVPGSRMYRTGDLARLRPSGELEYIGRNDSTLKIRGYRVDLTEIEAALRSLDGIEMAAVTTFTSPAGHQQLVAYVVTESMSAAESGVRLSGILPKYMLPSVYIEVPDLVVNRNGKLDWSALPDPVSAYLESLSGGEATNDVEHTIADVWRDLLRVETVGVDANFFDIGGDSLHAAMAQVALMERGLTGISVTDILTCPTPRSLARRVGNAGPAAEHPDPNQPSD